VKQSYSIVVNKADNQKYNLAIKSVEIPEIEQDHILVRVHFSSVNFKDIMSCSGNPAITRRFPHIPGIDAVGVVEKSTSKNFKSGDSVLVFCCAMGMTTNGGFSEYVQVPAKWALKISNDWSKELVMAYGTAGFTAAMCVEKLGREINLHQSNIAVSGATGGVGCFAIAMLAKLGVNVTAITGQIDHSNFLYAIGAERILNRSDLLINRKQNLSTVLWDGAVDVAGGDLLASILTKINNFGVVTACGIVEKTSLETNMLPFILRGVSLCGINAEHTSANYKANLWNKIFNDWIPEQIDKLYHVVDLNELLLILQNYKQLKPVGRIVVKLI
jgi:putative YhdH/YhfP family quinone oxidoreductase